MTVANDCKFCGSRVESQLQKIGEWQASHCHISCPKCGVYEITATALAVAMPEVCVDDLHLFSGYLRNHSLAENPVKIDSTYLARVPEIVSPFRNMSVSEKMDNVLKYIYGIAPRLSGSISLDRYDVYQFYLKSAEELDMITKTLDKRHWVSSVSSGVQWYTCDLTFEGWERFEKLKEINVNSKKVFIACKFDTDYKEKLVEIIKSACKKRGFKAKLVSDERHNGDISHKIIGDIRESRFVVADFTGENNGAYFEAGYGMGMGLEVIKLCQKKDVDAKRLHFDTNHYSHIVWEEGEKGWEKLEEDLINQIKATIK